MIEYVCKVKEYRSSWGETYRWAEEYKEHIVRCRDCKHYYEAEDYHPQGNVLRCCCKYFDAYSDEIVPDGFCAWGEAR